MSVSDCDTRKSLQAAEGWLELGNHLEAHNELELLPHDQRLHPDVLTLLCRIYEQAGKWDSYRSWRGAYRHMAALHCERQNLSMRMGMRRFTRLMNGFSKKLENHEADCASLHALQFRSDSPEPARHACDGGGDFRSRWTLEEIVRLLG